MKKIIAIIALLIALPALPALANEPAVKSIDLPKFQPYLPPGPGRELFATACLSCHSTRYITMQPVVPVAKWEENVKKMVKTYGAPIAEDQAPALAQYLVAVQQSPPDPLYRVVANPPRPVERLNPGQADRGQTLYARACASCHGTSGHGDGMAMKNFLPTATDLTAGRFAPRAIALAVMNGVPGTSMPAFPSFSADDVQDVVAYTMQLGTADAAPAPTDQGKLLFQQSCASCHGAEGKGDGFNAPTLPRAATNFHVRQPSEGRAMQLISDGVAGTSMPSWKAKLDEPQRKLLSDYVRSFYDEGGSR